MSWNTGTVKGVLGSLGIPYADDSWAPSKPPAGSPYALIVERVEPIGGDFFKPALMHYARVVLYDDGLSGASARRELATALASAGIGFTREEPDYFYDEKVYQTIYTLDGWCEKGIGQ